MTFAETEKTELKQKFTNLDESLKKIADMLESQILPDCRSFVELGTKYINQKHIIEIGVRKGDDLYYNYIKKYGRSSQRGFTINEKTFAENFHLLTRAGSYNKMAELLADKNEVSIKVVRFKGKSKSDGIAMRNEYGEKCLVVAMKQAYDYCADVINETHTSFTNGIRNDMPLFDRDAFREVWFNACLHNNWADGTPPAIYIYTDRMEIISTGGLPQNLSKDDFFRGVSKPVNEELAKLFIRLDLVEQTGYGIPLVTNRYGKTVFEFLDFFLRVKIPFEFELESEDIQDVPQGSQKSSQKSSQKIIEMIKQNAHVTTQEMADTLGVSRRAVAKTIAKLQETGCVRRVGSDKGGHWEIIMEK
ncbi:MAG: HTH domain-containing protein [Spirochaetales bacterium]|nr:HTH domain-containing protein [Spirochaetales bacterium]